MEPWEYEDERARREAVEANKWEHWPALGIVQVASTIDDPLLREGVKYDQDKLRYDLIPTEMLDGLATVLTYGARKYKDRNWELGMSWGRPFGALMRHMWAWWKGEDRDQETGYSHLWHALCCLTFLATYEARRIGQDDRWRGASYYRPADAGSGPVEREREGLGIPNPLGQTSRYKG